MKTDTQTRTYKRSECAVFSKTKEAFGGLSNMAAGFPLRVNGVRILTSEALYQACRFPHRPEVQRIIIGEASPMTAKMKSKPYRKDSRPDWDRVRVKVMRWCLRVKLAQNWNEFSRLLLATRERSIVEESRKDDFWGAKVMGDETLVGMNVLGRLLMELREEIKQGDRERLSRVEPLDISDFRLYGEQISAIEVRLAKSEAVPRSYKVSDSGSGVYERQVGANPKESHVVQTSLFDREQQVAVNTSRNSALIDALEPYSSMKDSGLPWVGGVPVHWNLLPNRALIRRRKVLVGDRHAEYRLLSLTKQGIIVRDVESGKGKFSTDMSTFQQVRKGDLVFCLFDVPETPRTVGLSNHEGMITGAYTVFECPDPTLAAFVDLFYRAMDDRKLLSPLYSGLRNTIPPTRFLGTKTPIPPTDEQAAIVRFLDYVNRRIERSIWAKRKVIALLNEQKQAIIHRAVTRGLDPRVPLKPSGISWLGEIPQHWEVRPLKHWATLNSRTLTERTSPDYEFRYLDIGAVGTGRLTREPERLKFKEAPSRARRVLRQGDTIISTVRTYLKAVYFVGVPDTDLVASTGFAVLSPGPDILPEFLSIGIQSPAFIDRVTANSIGIAYPAIAESRLGVFHLAIPPNKTEQAAITEHVRRKSAPFDTTIMRLEREIALLREYRTRLIADVVMGKLDVRAAARNLPVEIEKAETVPDLEEVEEKGMEELASAEGGDE